MVAKHAVLDILVTVAALVYRVAPFSVVHNHALLENISDRNAKTGPVTHEAGLMLNNLATSRGSLEARIRRKASLASMSERERIYSITPCS